MVSIYCDECNGEVMELVCEDSRQEWYEATYECRKCGKQKVHCREFDQAGLVTSDTIEDY